QWVYSQRNRIAESAIRLLQHFEIVSGKSASDQYFKSTFKKITVMKTHVYKKLGILLSAILLLSGCKDEGTFDNNVYLVTPTLEINLNKPSVTTDERTLQIGIAKPEAEDIRADFSIDPSLVARYNKAHSEQAILLSEEYYSLT